MVVYDLSCPLEHHFEGWFASASSFEDQRQEGHLVCPFCQSRDISKRPSAPYLREDSHEPQRLSHPGRKLASSSPPVMMVSGQLVNMLRHYIVQQVLSQTEDVGERFVETVREMHYGDQEPRNVRGMASQDDVQELHEEGIEVMVLGISEGPTPHH